MLKHKVLITMTSVVAGLSVSAAASLIANGSFESLEEGQVPESSATFLAGGWTMEPGGRDPMVLSSSAYSSPSPDGGNAVSFQAGDAISGMFQEFNDKSGTIAAEDGVSFDISFYAGRRSGQRANDPGWLSVGIVELSGGAIVHRVANQLCWYGPDENWPGVVAFNVAQGNWSPLVSLTLVTSGTISDANTLGILLSQPFTFFDNAEPSVDGVKVSVQRPPAAGAIIMLR